MARQDPSVHCYVATIGTFEFWIYSATDDHARRVVSRWIALFWERAKARLREHHAGSIAHAVCDGWYQPPEVRIVRWPMDYAGVILTNEPATMIDSYQIGGA